VLVIEHTYAEGTCLEGTRRSDDLYATLRSLGWLFRRSVRDYRLQASQDRPAKRGAIEGTVAAFGLLLHDVGEVAPVRGGYLSLHSTAAEELGWRESGGPGPTPAEGLRDQPQKWCAAK
jgi:hypothetical protein